MVSYSRFETPTYCESRRLGQLRAFYLFHSVRHGGTAQQCLWLGSGRYLRGCGRRHTNTDTYGDANTHGHSNSDTNTNRYAYTYFNAETYADGASTADAKAAANSCSTAIAVIRSTSSGS